MKAFYKDKKIFITGHTGFKGTWACNVLSFFGSKITGYALEMPPNSSFFEETGTAEKINSIIGDVRDREKLIATVKQAEPDIVFHFAAQPLVRRSYKEPALSYETNVMGTVNILEAVRYAPSIRSFVNVTTDKVYENKEREGGYIETENLMGFDPYSNSKSCAELVTASYRNCFFCEGAAAAISTARSGNVIGGGDYAEDRIIPDCIRAAEKGKTIIVRNPLSVRPYQHVLECLCGYFLLAKKQFDNKNAEGAYNFGPDEDACITTGALAQLFCEAWKDGAAWQAAEDAQAKDAQTVHEANFLKLDCSKSKAVLAWQPHWDIKTAVEKTVAFAKAHNGAERKACVENQIKEYFD
ncbi:MAG: CDP-glucose 4,6-dehydratase [Termitinemataceae bacterium]|nr:MAG: CDP-glucose 4,6-dehydratase [Termitinemataceae bacterium]